jgi:hypothetical protein
VPWSASARLMSRRLSNMRIAWRISARRSAVRSSWPSILRQLLEHPVQRGAQFVGDGVGQAVRGAVQVLDPVQHRVDMGFEKAEFVLGPGAGEAGVKLAFGHLVGKGVDAVDPCHHAAGREPADERACDEEGTQKAEHSPAKGGERVVDGLQAARDEEGEAARQLSRDGEPAGVAFGEGRRRPDW